MPFKNNKNESTINEIKNIKKHENVYPERQLLKKNRVHYT